MIDEPPDIVSGVLRRRRGNYRGGSSRRVVRAKHQSQHNERSDRLAGTTGLLAPKNRGTTSGDHWLAGLRTARLLVGSLVRSTGASAARLANPRPSLQRQF